MKNLSFVVWGLAFAALGVVACIEAPREGRDTGSDAGAPTTMAHTLTYGDAYQGWARGYCAYAERCFPQWVWRRHFTEEGCVGDIQVDQCGQDWAKCAAPFPVAPKAFPGQPDATLDVILRCTADTAQLDCTAAKMPESCDALR